jgi:DNA-binding protein HU-beta
MNKGELIQAVAKSEKMSKAAAERVANSVLDNIKKGLKKDKNVTLIGFGTFTVKSRKARMGRNPQTGEKIRIKASRTVGFKPGEAFKKMV